MPSKKLVWLYLTLLTHYCQRIKKFEIYGVFFSFNVDLYLFLEKLIHNFSSMIGLIFDIVRCHAGTVTSVRQMSSQTRTTTKWQSNWNNRNHTRSKEETEYPAVNLILSESKPPYLWSNFAEEKWNLTAFFDYYIKSE